MHLNIAEFLPQTGAMCLLHRLLNVDQSSLVAEADILADNIFVAGNRLDAWVGIEYMAQAVAAWSGYHARELGGAPQIGYLLGTRHYHCSRAAFAVGDCLQIHVEREMQIENGLGRFNCSIQYQNENVATAALNVYQSPLNTQ